MKTAQESVTITKEKIAEELKNNLGLSSLICEDVVVNLFSELLQMVESDGKATLQKFGTWRINHKDTRPGFNIKTGDEVNIEARNVLRFTPSKTLKKQINISNVN